MPIPAPRTDETQREYVSRCYGDIKVEYDTPVAIGICYNKLREKKMLAIAKMKRKKK